MIDNEKYFLKTYRRKKVTIDKHEGMYLYTNKGKLLDMLSGIGVNALGGKNSGVRNAICCQLEKYMHTSNFFLTEPALDLAKYLIDNSFADKLFFTNSGTESIEAGLKVIKKYGSIKGKDNIVVFKDGFHGRSLGSMSVTAQNKFKTSGASVLSGVVELGFNDIDALDGAIDDKCAGVILEPVQGSGGVNVANRDFFRKIRELTEKHDALMFVDEIQTGIGRTGKLFAYENYDVSPDMVALSKALGGGLPLGALLVSEKLADIFKPGDHGSTFGGNPISCAAGLALVKQVNDKEFLDNIVKCSDYLVEKLNVLHKKYPEKISNIRHLGLMVGIEIAKSPEKVAELFEDEHVLVSMIHVNVLRLLPPLIITESEIDFFIEAFENVLEKL